MGGYGRFAPEISTGTIDKRVVIGAAIAGILVDLNSMLIPILAIIGGGVVAGFIAGYAIGKPGQGLVHAAVASAIVGVAASMSTLALGVTLGLYNEPPLLFLGVLGPISPIFSDLGFPGVVLLTGTLTLFVMIDGVIGGLLGAGLKSIAPW